MPNKYVDVKVTVWNRMHFDNEADMQKFIEMIKENRGVTGLFEDENGYCEDETLLDTEEVVHVEDNNGLATIEVYEDDQMIWDNSAGMGTVFH